MTDKMDTKPDLIQKAKDMAKSYHEGQTRRGSAGFVPYYDEHILGVYNILKDECQIDDEEVLVTALLHDTVEDTSCTLEDIERAFGPEIKRTGKASHQNRWRTVFCLCQTPVCKWHRQDYTCKTGGQTAQPQNHIIYA